MYILVEFCSAMVTKDKKMEISFWQEQSTVSEEMLSGWERERPFEKEASQARVRY